MSTIWDRFVQIYDTAATGSPITSGHFRGRVTTHKVWQKWTGTEEPDYIVYYDYDLMGRVKREIHEIPMLKRFKHDKFEMSYLYDAVSGKVREMIYNKGRKDEFRHRFAYDAMGNLKYIWTSRDGKKWTLESALKYYPDGKLLRREIRPKDLMLQGLDYAYTLDGWLKAINSEVLENDPSKDGISGTYQYFARDVFSLLLRYYPNDYKSIKPTVPSLEASITSGSQHLYKPYYTGWISSWPLHLDTLHTAYSFRYDRLGRLTKATTLTGFNGSEWDANLVKNYSTKYSYDLVGNILNLTRYDGTGRLIDELKYNYYNLARNNRLEYISDKVGRIIGIDLDNQSPENYRYDPVGNMVFDKSRSLRVSYTYSNKPKRINLGGQTIRMFYNPSGYRFFKGSGNNKGQVFIYNSQGQLMAKYTINGNKLKLDFMPIYEGTKRLGILEPEGVEWYAKRKCYVKNPLTGEEIEVPCGGEFDVVDAPMLRVMPRGEGRVLKPSRKYELTDHLNNVRVVIRDQRLPMSQNGSPVAYYKPLVESIHDYYPFGWEKQLTTVNPYPFTYQGQLFDRDLGWQYYRYRNYDPLIARFHQVEPLVDSFPWWSSYGYVFGNPVLYVEHEGSNPGVGAVIAYFAKVATKTAVDIALDYLIAEFTGVKPTWVDYVINFGLNLIPSTGWANTAKKIAKFRRIVKETVESYKYIEGLSKLRSKINEDFNSLMKAIKSGDAHRIESQFGQLRGKLFELRLATSIEGVVEVGFTDKIVRKGVEELVEVDLVIKKNGKLIFGEVKGSDFSEASFKDFYKDHGDQLEKLLDYAKSKGAELVYYFKKGQVSQDIIEGLNARGVKVVEK